MDFQLAITTLRHNGRRLAQMAADLTADQAHWRPDLSAWSTLEVMCHLYDEEREDFRVRLGHILAKSPPPWPPIDPQGWVVSRRYAERDLAQTIAGFAEEREKSLAWLVTLEGTDWQTSFAASFGDITAGDMLAGWVAHDILHLRQLVELQWGYWQAAVAPSYLTLYAGEW